MRVGRMTMKNCNKKCKFKAYIFGHVFIFFLPLKAVEMAEFRKTAIWASRVNPLTTGKGHFWPTCFLTPRLSVWPLHKIQNVTNVKFRSLALIFNSKFDHKLFSSLKIT